MFNPTHTFHGIPVQILSHNDDGSIVVQSRSTINDGNMGPEILNAPLTVLSSEWLYRLVSSVPEAGDYRDGTEAEDTGGY